MKFHPTDCFARRLPAAFTLPEMLVSLGAGSIILGAVALLSIFSSRSFVAMGNYMDLDKASRNALDQMSRDIRETLSLTSYQTNRLVFADSDGSPLTYTWSPSTGKLTTTKNGVTKTLLSQCDYLSFRISQRNPIPGVFDFYTASNNPALCKLIDVSWKCSRTLLGQKINTESVQTAKIVIRN